MWIINIKMALRASILLPRFRRSGLASSGLMAVNTGMLRRLQELIGPKIIPADRAGRGEFGEREAGKLLKKKGMKVLRRNWRAGKDEIDLIAQDGPVLVFVEVRTRQADALVSGYHSVRGKKKQALLRVCKAYINRSKPRPPHFRLDIIEVRLGISNDFTIHHFENIPLFPDSFS